MISDEYIEKVIDESFDSNEATYSFTAARRLLDEQKEMIIKMIEGEIHNPVGGEYYTHIINKLRDMK